LAQALVAASASIILALGVLHLLYTFRSSKLHPRDPELEARLKAISPVITRETTMWKAWIGFNASHGLGALLFGLVYGYLALARGALLFGSPFLCAVGLLLLVGYLVLAKLYWFRVPFRGILVALACYVAGLAVALV
jgi:hypothetical protein